MTESPLTAHVDCEADGTSLQFRYDQRRGYASEEILSLRDGL
jgi:hypothetical protein